MRLALFETSKVLCAISLDKVLHVLTGPHVYRLPLLRPCFAGGLVYQGQVVPLLIAEYCNGLNGNVGAGPAFTLVCEAEFGLVAVPADRMLRITKSGEVCVKSHPGCDTHDETCEIGGRDYRLLYLNRVMEDSPFTVCGLKD